jgi:hypothetical protein
MARTLAEMMGHMHDGTRCMERRPEHGVPAPLVVSDGDK